MRAIRRLAFATVALLSWQSVVAMEVNFSGFGTIGYAISDKQYDYQRFINDDGTFMRDSLLGLQADVKFNNHWGATVQGVVAASEESDNSYDINARWAFVSYRPTNDWLFRAGKLRIGSFLNMQNMEVSTTYDMARLPAEVYSVAPVYDFTGLSINKTWYTDNLEINLEAVQGRTKSAWRQYVSGSQEAKFLPIDIDVKGLMLSVNKDDDLYRLGWYRVDVESTKEPHFTGSYTVIPNDPTIPGNPLAGLGGDLIIRNAVDRTTADVFTLGADVHFDNGIRVMGEYARRLIDQVDTGPDTHAFHVNLSKNVGSWTPYLGYAKMWSGRDERRNWKKARDAIVPSTGGAMPAMDQAIAQGYQDLASAVYVYDQNSVMLGAAYRIGATQKIKFEVMRTHIGETSSMVDGDVSNDDVLVFSLSYTFAF
ncbi:hypothetical protein [Thiomicrospira microaerophila]|uniref:hypothetical protein n=1 Tax=Thiomicrospira microaerophila TaxID=406020 RepID=UPI0005CB41D7|nr:hypothetical protein [Thiomicrospira microaerophila]